MVYLPKMKTHAAHLHTAQSGVYLPACRIDTFAALKHFFNVSLTMSSLILYGRCWVGASAPQPTAADSPHADAETICKLDPEKKKEPVWFSFVKIIHSSCVALLPHAFSEQMLNNYLVYRVMAANYRNNWNSRKYNNNKIIICIIYLL